MGKKLRALGSYENGPRGLTYKRGEEFEASNDLFLFLMADAPGNFEPVADPKENPYLPQEYRDIVEPPTKALDKPPADKMVKTPKARK